LRRPGGWWPKDCRWRWSSPAMRPAGGCAPTCWTEFVSIVVFSCSTPPIPKRARVFDLTALDLHRFGAGATVAMGEQRYVVADPRREVAQLLRSIRAPVGSLREKLAFARWAIECGYGSAARIKRSPDRSLAEELHRRGLDGDLGRRVLQP